MATKKRTTRTAAQIKQQLKEAQQAYRERMRAHGLVTMSIWIEPDRRAKLKTEAEKRGLDLSEAVSEAILKLYKI